VLNRCRQSESTSAVVTRRTSREPVAQGGWSCFITQIDGVATCAPGGSFEPRGNGAKVWFGWPDGEELERLRTARFDAPDLPAQKAIAEKVRGGALDPEAPRVADV
jgi:peptide/nickel transport system substrate-binding protein